VNNVRTAFDIPQAEADDEQLTLLPDEIRLSDIRDASVRYINDELATIIGSINEAKEERILKYVQEEAPQYKILMRYRNEFINKIPPDATKLDIEAVADISAPGFKGTALFDMAHPGTAYDDPNLGKDSQPGHMRKIWFESYRTLKSNITAHSKTLQVQRLMLPKSYSRIADRISMR